MRLALILVVVLSVLAVGLHWLDSEPEAPRRPSPQHTRQRVAVVVGVVGSPGPLNLVGVLPAAQKSWNDTIHWEEP
jgi:hypothetical protein